MKSELPLSYPPEVPIWVDPERLSGAPCFKGTRVPGDQLVHKSRNRPKLRQELHLFSERHPRAGGGRARIRPEAHAPTRSVNILLDACTPRPLRKFLPGHSVSTAQEMGW